MDNIDLLQWFSEVGQGRVGRRQTTYWDLSGMRASNELKMRVHFRHKREWRYVEESFDSFTITDNHALLLDHLACQCQVSFKGRVEDPQDLLSTLGDAVASLTGEWRNIRGYLNPLMDPVELLESGSGVLLTGPVPVLQELRDLLECRGLMTTLLTGHTPATATQVLLLGRNFVVADGFRGEPI